MDIQAVSGRNILDEFSFTKVLSKLPRIEVNYLCTSRYLYIFSTMINF